MERKAAELLEGQDRNINGRGNSASSSQLRIKNRLWLADETAAHPHDPNQMKRTLAAALLLADLRPAVGFQSPSRSARTTLIFGGQRQQQRRQDRSTSNTADAITALCYADDPYSSSADPSSSSSADSALPDTTDPLVLLGLDAMSANDAQAIKTAYRKMTRRHHPDAVLNSDSTDEEKKAANDNFARINEAYQNLSTRQTRMGKGFGGEEFGAQTFVDLEVRRRSWQT